MTTAEVAVIARRRRFSDEQKQQLLDEVERTSLAAVCRRHDLSRSLLQRWKARVVAAPRGEIATSDGAAFARLLPSAAPTQQPAPASIYIHIDSSLVVELPASAGPRELAALVAALKS